MEKIILSKQPTDILFVPVTIYKKKITKSWALILLTEPLVRRIRIMKLLISLGSSRIGNNLELQDSPTEHLAVYFLSAKTDYSLYGITTKDLPSEANPVSYVQDVPSSFLQFALRVHAFTIRCTHEKL
jgi:hypothetical protein